MKREAPDGEAPSVKIADRISRAVAHRAVS